MSSLDESRFRIEPFDKKKHDRSCFDCDESSLNCYLKKQANQDFQQNVAVPFVLIEEGQPEIIGFYTLSSFQVKLKKLPSEKRNNLPRYPNVPATLLGRLAVDKEYQGMGLGEFLLMDALYKSAKQSAKIASFSIVVDAINEEARDFYLNFGFLPFPDRKDRLFLPMETINEAFKEELSGQEPRPSEDRDGG